MTALTGTVFSTYCKPGNVGMEQIVTSVIGVHVQTIVSSRPVLRNLTLGRSSDPTLRVGSPFSAIPWTLVQALLSTQ